MMSRLELRTPTIPGTTPGERIEEPEYAKFSSEALEVLKGYLQLDGKISLEDATKQILKMLTLPGPSLMQERCNGLTKETKYSFTGTCNVVPILEEFADQTHDTFSVLVIETARQIPHNHTAQVKLVRLLSHLTPRADDAGHFWYNYYCRPVPVQRALQPYWHTDHFRDLHDEIAKCKSPP